jgi:hypothetical protein
MSASDTVTRWGTYRARRTRCGRGVWLDGVAAVTAGAASAQRGICHQGRAGLEREAQRRRLRDAIPCGQEHLDGYEVHEVGGRTILEYWIPAEDLDELNANLVGLAEVVGEYR